jgi:hypothetical protein
MIGEQILKFKILQSPPRPVSRMGRIFQARTRW